MSSHFRIPQRGHRLLFTRYEANSLLVPALNSNAWLALPLTLEFKHMDPIREVANPEYVTAMGKEEMKEYKQMFISQCIFHIPCIFFQGKDIYLPNILSKGYLKRQCILKKDKQISYNGLCWCLSAEMLDAGGDIGRYYLKGAYKCEIKKFGHYSVW